MHGAKLPCMPCGVGGHEHGHTCVWPIHKGIRGKHVTRGHKCGKVGALQVQKVDMVGEHGKGRGHGGK